MPTIVSRKPKQETLGIKIFFLECHNEKQLGILNTSYNNLPVYQLSRLMRCFIQFLKIVFGATQIVLARIRSVKISKLNIIYSSNHIQNSSSWCSRVFLVVSCPELNFFLVEHTRGLTNDKAQGDHLKPFRREYILFESIQPK